MIVTLDEMKGQLNLTGDEDNDLVSGKIKAAQGHIETLLGFKLGATYGGAGQDEVPDALKEAVMQLAAHWYENREATIVGVGIQHVPYSIQEIVREYRKWSF